MSTEIIQNNPDDKKGSMYSYGRYAVNEMIKSLTLQDRLAGITLVHPDINDLTYEETIVSYDEFAALIERRLSYKRTFLEIYPVSDTHINITTFTSSDIIKILDDTHQVGIRFWYIK